VLFECCQQEDDEIWNKRQIMYIFVLTTTAGLVFLLQPLLPAAFGRWIIMVVAAAWGAGSIGLPCGLHGTARCEKECSRHVGRFIYTLFSVLVIYGFYLAAMRIGDAPAPTPSPSLKGGDRTSADSNGEFSWAFCFGMIGLFVLLGNLWSSVRVNYSAELSTHSRCLFSPKVHIYQCLLNYLLIHAVCFHQKFIYISVFFFWVQGCCTGGDRDP